MILNLLSMASDSKNDTLGASSLRGAAGMKKAIRPNEKRQMTAEKPQAGSMLAEPASQKAITPGTIAQEPENSARTTWLTCVACRAPRCEVWLRMNAKISE